MKKVLIIGPDFIPSNLPPALRIKGFVSHLLEFGWEPTVLSVDPHYYDWPIDRETERLLPENLRIIRTTALPDAPLRKIGIGDIALRALWQLWRRAVTLCREERFDLAFIPMPPYYQVVVGRLLRFQFDLPYVIDYIDPWTSIDYWKLPKDRRPLKRTVAYGLARLLEPIALKRASHIIGVSKGTTDHVMRTYPGLPENAAAEIPYGGDEDAFDYLRTHPRKNFIFDKSDGLFHLSYVGACNDAMKATIKALFAAVKLGLADNPDLFGKLRLHFVGTTYAAKPSKTSTVQSLANQCGIGNIVDVHPGRVSYLDALQLLLDSNSLLILGSDAPHYTASKIFPYILARKPLVVVFHNSSSVISILRDTNAAKAITFDSDLLPDARIDEIKKLIEEVLTLPGDYQPPTRWDAFEFYTCRSMTERLVTVFEKSVMNSGHGTVKMQEITG